MLTFTLRLLAILLPLSVLAPCKAQAQPEDVVRLTQEATSLYQLGRYAEAIPYAIQAVRAAETTYGTAHPEVATCVNNLALMYAYQGHYPEAEQNYSHALAIYEKAFGPDHPNTAISVTNLADLYKAQEKYAQAEPLYQRSLAIFEKTLGPDNQNVATVLIGIAGIHFAQGRYAQAVSLSKRALAIQEKVLGPDHQAIAVSLNNLAYLYSTQGSYAPAEPLLKRSLAITEKAVGPEHPNNALVLGNLAELYGNQGRYAEAESLFSRALAIQEKALGPEHPGLVIHLVNLAGIYRLQGRYTPAEQLCRRALAIVEKAFGTEHTHFAGTLTQLALLYFAQGQYAEVESLFKRSLAIQEKALGPEHPKVATGLNNLAGLYTTQGLYTQAEPLRLRALAIMEKSLGPDHPQVAAAINHIAYQYVVQEKYALAEPLYLRSLSILEKSLGPEHPDVGTGLYDLAAVYGKQGRYAEAVPLFKRALTIAENTFGPEHANVATCLHKEAELHKAQGQYALAEPLYQRSLRIAEKIVGPDHPGIALSLNSLAEMYRSQARYAEGLALARRASSIARQRILAGGTGDLALREAFTNRSGFRNHLALLALNPGKESADDIADEALQIGQLEQASGTAAAIAKMAARFASGDDVLAGLVKRKQDAVDQRGRNEAQLVKAASKPIQERLVTDEQRLRDEIVAIDKEVAAINVELLRAFPDYQELTRSEPLGVKRIRALLRPGEAMLVFALGDNSFLWVVKPDAVAFVPLQAVASDVSAKVATIRSEMEFDSAGNPRRVSIGVLHGLYRTLFAPAVPHLKGVSHIMVVPAGPLQSLPFGMLVASMPKGALDDSAYSRVDWLTRHYALSVLPAVSSIQAFRQFAKAGDTRQPFAGFGDPLIGESSSATRGKRGKLDVATVFRNLAVTADAPVIAPTEEVADVEAIRKAPRLPETADELRMMAKALKAGPDSVWLQANATETIVKALDLSKYRTIAFATHGVMAGEVRGMGESGLILTPPRQGTTADDGYLSASEIARLKLNADWVVLSACNTAAADGTPGAEGLSGLAKAFFYAGARSMLVSHWPVASEATVPLTTSMLGAYEANPAQGKAEAHRQAMLALMARRDHPEYAHPIFWAPFVVVGEGGAPGLALP